MKKEIIKDLIVIIFQIITSGIATYGMFNSGNSLTGVMTLTVLIFSIFELISILIWGDV